MLHRKRLQDHEANNATVRAFVDELNTSKSLFSTPPGSNDDW